MSFRVCVCVCVCLCIARMSLPAYIYIYIYICIYIYIYIYIYNVCYVCAYVYIYACTCICIYISQSPYLYTQRDRERERERERETRARAHTHTHTRTGGTTELIASSMKPDSLIPGSYISSPTAITFPTPDPAGTGNTKKKEKFSNVSALTYLPYRATVLEMLKSPFFLFCVRLRGGLWLPLQAVQRQL